MAINLQKLIQILVICILLISVLSVTGCIVTEEKKSKKTSDDNGDKNNNTTNGDDNNITEEEPIEFTLYHEPETPTIESEIKFYANITSMYILEKDSVEIIICEVSTGICKLPEKMEEYPDPETRNLFVYSLQITKDQFEPGLYWYHIVAKDSVGNVKQSEDIEFEIVQQ
jgi:hypothetical protein